MIDAALQLAARGFRVFPIRPGAKYPPLVKAFPEKATTDETTVRQWWLATPNANIGIAADGLTILDIDVSKGGDTSFANVDMVYGVPETLVARTPSGGRHVYLRGETRNGVDVLGSGLDVRSTAGGYVVAPGSRTPAGSYEWSNDVSIADTPGWLVQKLGAPRERSADVQGVGDAPDEVVQRAAEWLKTAERSNKGQGGDQAAYRVACGLRDMGVSYGQACELMRSDAWDLGCGWREGRLEDKPIRSAYKYATGEPGSRAALPGDFPVIENADKSDISEKRVQKTSILRLVDFAEQSAKGAGYVIKGFLQRRSYAEAFGAPGEGKTFVMLDMAYHVAAETPWMEHKVHGGPVLYLAFEGRGGLVSRAKALRQHYGLKDIPLYIAGASFNLREKTGRQALGQLIGQMPDKPVLIVFDTFAKALMGGDENSAQDVGAFNNAIEALIQSTGACVAIVHHSGKDPNKGARGSSALLGALDTEIQIGDGQITVKKQRDVEIAEPIGFRLVPLVVGIDQDGDDISSCIVQAGAAAAVGLPRISGNARRAFDLLCELSPGNTPVAAGDWKTKCAEFLGPRSVAQRFYDVKKTLAAKGYIIVDQYDNVTRKMT